MSTNGMNSQPWTELLTGDPPAVAVAGSILAATWAARSRLSNNIASATKQIQTAICGERAGIRDWLQRLLKEVKEKRRVDLIRAFFARWQFFSSGLSRREEEMLRSLLGATAAVNLSGSRFLMIPCTLCGMPADPLTCEQA